MAEMLAVATGAAPLLHPLVLRQRQRRFVDNAGHGLEPLQFEACWIDCDAGLDQSALAVIDREHFAGEGPEIVDRTLRTGVALVGAVAEPYHPFGRVAQVIGALLLRLRRDGSQGRIG